MEKIALLTGNIVIFFKNINVIENKLDKKIKKNKPLIFSKSQKKSKKDN